MSGDRYEAGVGRLIVAGLLVLAAGLVGLFGLLLLNAGYHLESLVVTALLALAAYALFLVTAPEEIEA